VELTSTDPIPNGQLRPLPGHVSVARSNRYHHFLASGLPIFPPAKLLVFFLVWGAVPGAVLFVLQMLSPTWVPDPPPPVFSFLSSLPHLSKS